MHKVDERKIQEIKDHFAREADLKIAYLTAEAEKEDREFSEDEAAAVRKGSIMEVERRIDLIREMGPKRLHQIGMALNMDGWRTGYTKPTIEKRVEKRRKNKKMSKMSKRRNRK